MEIFFIWLKVPKHLFCHKVWPRRLCEVNDSDYNIKQNTECLIDGFVMIMPRRVGRPPGDCHQHHCRQHWYLQLGKRKWWRSDRCPRYCQTVKIRTSKAWNLWAFYNCLTAQSSIDSNYAVKVLQPYFVGQEYLHSKKNVNHNLLTYNYKHQLTTQHELCSRSVH